MPSKEYQLSYPQGGLSSKKGGQGLFVDPESGDQIQVWLDPSLPSRIILQTVLEGEGAAISPRHHESTTSLLILYPRSTEIFDMYCHPSWLPPESHFRPRKSGYRHDTWTSKVILKHTWIEACVVAGRFLGHDDDWGKCRVGGPPVTAIRSAMSSVQRVQPNPNPITLKIDEASSANSSAGVTGIVSSVVSDLKPKSKVLEAALPTEVDPAVPVAPSPTNVTRDKGLTIEDAIPLLSDDEEDEEEDKEEIEYPGSAHATPSGSEPDDMSNESLIGILEEAYRYMLRNDLLAEQEFDDNAMNDFAMHMEMQHATFDEDTWKTLFWDWRNKTGRFAYLAHRKGTSSKRPASFLTKDPVDRPRQKTKINDHDKIIVVDEEKVDAAADKTVTREIDEEHMARVNAAKWPERIVESDWKGYKSTSGRGANGSMSHYKRKRESIDDIAKVLYETGQVQSRSQSMMRSSAATKSSDGNAGNGDDNVQDSDDDGGDIQMRSEKVASQTVSNSYTDEEDAEMATFVATKLPDGPTYGQWKYFHGIGGRSTGGYYERYRAHKKRFLLMAREVPPSEYYQIGSTNQTAVLTPSSNAPRKARKYTEEEERAMAAYINSGLPRKIGRSADDWKEFARSHDRTPEALCQKYRSHQYRIDNFARELRGESFDKSAAADDDDEGEEEEGLEMNERSNSLDRPTLRESASASNAPTSKKSLPYTKEERLEMAAYINSRPAGTVTRQDKTWEGFHSRLGRTSIAISQQYWTNKALIDGYARDLRGEGASSSSGSYDNNSIRSTFPDGFSEMEEKAMATFIARLYPRGVEEEDWKGFDAMLGPPRNPEEYVKHYDTFKKRIDQQAKSIRIDLLVDEMEEMEEDDDEDYSEGNDMDPNESDSDNSAIEPLRQIFAERRHRMAAHEASLMDLDDVEESQDGTIGGDNREPALGSRPKRKVVKFTEDDVSKMAEYVSNPKHTAHGLLDWTTFFIKYPTHSVASYYSFYRRNQKRIDCLARDVARAQTQMKRASQSTRSNVAGGRKHGERPILKQFDPAYYDMLRRCFNPDEERRMAKYMADNPPDDLEKIAARPGRPSTKENLNYNQTRYWKNFPENPADLPFNPPRAQYCSINLQRIQQYLDHYRKGQPTWTHPHHQSKEKSEKPISPEDEIQMAKYIASRQPSKRTTENLPDWAHLSIRNPHRSVVAYAAHYHEFQDKIDSLVETMVPGWRKCGSQQGTERIQVARGPEDIGSNTDLPPPYRGSVFEPGSLFDRSSNVSASQQSKFSSNTAPSSSREHFGQRPTSKLQPNPKSKPRMRVKFSHAEEVVMARYVYDTGMLDSKTKSTEKDWINHAAKYPKRTARAFCRRYIKYRKIIDGIARNIKYREERQSTRGGGLSSSGKSSSQAMISTSTPIKEEKPVVIKVDNDQSDEWEIDTDPDVAPETREEAGGIEDDRVGDSDGNGDGIVRDKEGSAEEVGNLL